MAERAGFEPAVELPLHTLSKRAPSATRTPLRYLPVWFSSGRNFALRLFAHFFP